jgi:hypothetical protein
MHGCTIVGPVSGVLLFLYRMLRIFAHDTAKNKGCEKVQS